ncbi:unnamed protein product [Phytophthora lilii]|uniref:Unnamed protein product n=1 Tax=Phytophthora lilii TaxID=2077276 RepID=A0A9W6WMD4_9STRA|nr:unnamed protein product [Phytophthora lilii]
MSIQQVVQLSHTFRHYSAARYTCRCDFLAGQHFKPEVFRVTYHSEKHKLHGVSVIPTGLVINCSHHYGGCEADIAIFRKNKKFHVTASTKPSTDDNISTQTHSGRNILPESWAILAGKEFGQRDASSHPSPPTSFHPIDNFFGKLCTLWTAAADVNSDTTVVSAEY